LVSLLTVGDSASSFLASRRDKWRPHQDRQQASEGNVLSKYLLVSAEKLRVVNSSLGQGPSGIVASREVFQNFMKFEGSFQFSRSPPLAPTYSLMNSLHFLKYCFQGSVHFPPLVLGIGLSDEYELYQSCTLLFASVPIADMTRGTEAPGLAPQRHSTVWTEVNLQRNLSLVTYV
jgi:hypothetical protein